MKKPFLIVLFYFLCLINCLAQEMSFNETTFFFGEKNEVDGAFSHDFHFINSGDKVLVIRDVVPGPGCTASGWKSSYEPGERGTVRITYHPENRVRSHLNIPSQIVTNVAGTPYGLTITGDIILTSHPSVKYFDLKKENKEKEKTLSPPQDDYDLILRRYVDRLINTNEKLEKELKSVPDYVKSMRKDGSWSYLDYDNRYATNWEPLYHLVQLLRMAFAYSLPESDYYGNKTLYNAIIQGLRYWYQKKPTSKNWYANQISAPNYIVQILAVMELGKTTTEARIKAQLLEMINNSDPNSQPTSGKIKIGMIHLIRGCLLEDYEQVALSSSQLFEPIRLSDREGIQKDLSYLDHGRQLYIGGYGLNMIEEAINAMGLLEGTQYAMPEEKMSLLSEYIRGTYFNTFRSCYIDYSVIGRSIASENSLLNKNKIILNKLIHYDAIHASEYRDIQKRFEIEDPTYERTDRNQLFYLADYMLHNRKSYDFSVRCVSSRTIHDEVANGEGLLSTYLADGATNIRVFGDEYYNIFPVWEWDKIPGTTTPVGEIRNHYVENGETGHTSFVGGASDGLYGVMVYLMDDHGIKAHKSWFTFDEEVVCLGSGIKNSSSKAINTSVNQCHLKGNVLFLNTNKKIIKANTKKNYRGFIWHNNIAYFFPSYTSITLKTEYQKGSWNKINYNQSSTEISLPVFNLYIEHGSDRVENDYEYILIPGKDLQQLQKYNPNNIQILSNTESLQAVYNKKLDVLQAVFYEPGTVKIGGKKISVKYPSTLIITDLKTSTPKITITDPTQERILSEYKDYSISK